jgi:hypothetical protein
MRTHSPPRVPHIAVRRRLLLTGLGMVAALVSSSCQAPQPAAMEGIGESVLQLGDAVSTLQIENAVLQEQIDSLRIAVAKQDTALRRFANLAGMPLQ